jgi:hypothetical protein
MTHEELMSQLKDIHAAQRPLWWPPAPGYYLMVGLVLLLVVVIFFAFRFHRRRRVKQTFLRELSLIENDFIAHNDNAILQASLSALFRRLAFFAVGDLPKNSELDGIAPVLYKLSRDKKRVDAIIDMLKVERFQKMPKVDGPLLISLSREQIKRCRI